MTKRPSIIAGLPTPITPEKRKEQEERISEFLKHPPEDRPPLPNQAAAEAAVATINAAAAAYGRRPKPDVVHTSIYLPKSAHRRLKEIALTRDVKVHDLIVEGINSILEKHGHAAIEPRKGTRT